MKIDCTKRQEARYIVGSYDSASSLNHYYTHYLEHAKRIFNSIKDYAQAEGKGMIMKVDLQNIKTGKVEAYWETEGLRQKSRKKGVITQ